MGRGRLYALAVCGLLLAGGVVGWRTWAHTSAGPFDPVAVVIALAGLAVSVAALGVAARAQRQADTDVAAVAGRLAVAVGKAETEARRQLLGGGDRAIDVRFAFRPAATHTATGAGSRGTLENVVSYYRKLQPRRMVITGAAGSGKTVLAVELILGLLKDREADAPVPVRMSAAALDTSRPAESAVADWLAEHLRQAYGLPQAAAQQLVAARMVVPVLDGLDEMDAVEAPGYASRAGQAIRACNAYLEGTQKAAMVLTCRISQYEALEQAREWVRDAARIQLRPVGVAAARSFLARRVTDEARWLPVLDQMRRPGGQPLAAALATPWRLTLAAAVYDQRAPATGAYARDPAELTGPGLGTEEEIRDHLLGLFIPAAAVAHPGRYPASRVHRWLGVLAGYLDGNTPAPGRPARVIAGRTLSGSDLVLHELWPLAGSRAPRVLSVAGVSVASVGLVALLLTHAAIGFTLRQITGAAGVSGLAVWAICSTWVAWPSVYTFDLRRLKTSRDRRGLVGRLVGGLAFGIVAGIVGGLVIGLAVGIVAGIAFGIAGELVVGLVIGLVVGLAAGLATDPDEYSVADPRQILRGILVGGLALALVVNLVVGLVVGLVGGVLAGLVAGLVGGMVVALALGPLGSFWEGLPGLRYIALLLCTRRWNDRWLPWWLGSFLHWCYQAGLIRVAGISYQFRHRELQDYLARNPAPPQPGPAVLRPRLEHGRNRLRRETGTRPRLQ